MTKAVYEVTNPGLPNATYNYIDPDDISNPNAVGLKFTMMDSQSKRSFFDQPISIDHVGPAKKPYIFNSPVMLLPNGNTEFTIYNTHATKTYVTVITFFGYRVRIEDAHLLLGLVTK